MRWGKTTKNTRRRDPRYFLNEDMRPQEQETEALKKEMQNEPVSS
jgi:hypothetical protein